MAWDEEMVVIVRGLLQDYPDPTTGDAPKYTDERIAENIAIAAQGVQAKVRFSRKYLINVVDVTISPDPTLPASRDEDFINLTCLKTACNLIVAQVSEMTNQGISVRDGSSAVALGRAPQSLKILRDSYCDEFENAVYTYLLGESEGAVGEAIVGPYKFAYDGNYMQINPYFGPVGRTYRNPDRENWYGGWY